MPRIIHTILGPGARLETDALPRICQNKTCLNVASKGEPLCAACLKSFGWEPGFYRQARKEYRETANPPRPRAEHQELIGVVGRHARVCTIIYMVRAGLDGPIKIGKTASLSDRIDSLQTGNPYKLHLIATLHAPELLESQLHAYLDQYRMQGEWFKPSDEVLNIAALMVDGNLDGILTLFERRIMENDNPDA